MRRLRSLRLPPWRLAPMRMLSSPSLFASVAVAAGVLALAAASKPVFVSASASAALHQDLVRGCRYGIGLRVSREAAVPGVARPPLSLRARPPVEPRRATRLLDREVSPIEGVDPAVVTVRAGDAEVVTTGPGAATVQLMSRTGAHKHIDVTDAVGKPGIWLPDTVAGSVQAVAGDEIGLRFEGRETVVPLTVRGVFRDLAQTRRGPFWCSSERAFEENQLVTPPPVALLDEAMLFEVLGDGGVPKVAMTWEYAPDADGWVLDRAERAVARLTDVASSTNNDLLPLGREFDRGPASVDQASTVHHATRAAAIVDASAGPVSLGAAGVALLVLVLGARSWIGRRRQELVILGLRGAGPALLAAKGVLEMATPALAGGVLGTLGALAVVRRLGPSRLVERDALVTAVTLVAVALGVALAALAAAVVTGARRLAVEPVGAPGARPLRWEPIALAVALAAFYELRTRGSSVVGGTRVDSLVLLFPVLLLAGGGGLLARLALHRRLLQRGRTWPVAPWLAIRRIGARRLHAVPVVTGTAVAIGIVVFATTTSTSLRATADAKATLGPGAAQVLILDEPVPLPATSALSPIATAVTRTSENTVVVEGHVPADVVGIDPDTFVRAAFWDGSFANRSLASLVASLAADGAVAPAIAVGEGLADRFTLSLSATDGTARIPVRIVARADAFPGYRFNSTRPLVVVDQGVLAARGVVDRAELWVDSNRTTVAAEARADGLPVNRHFLASERLEQGSLEPQVWALQYLEVIGVAAGVVALSGLGLYFAVDAAARRAGTALARRMGMTARTAVAATVLEVAALLAVGLVAGGALAWVAGRLVFDYLDPLPNAPPAPILRFDVAALAIGATVAAVTAVFVALLVERRAHARPLPELLHDAE